MDGSTLQTRDQFREGVFKRDDYQCVICKAPAVDAHHILERRLWPDEGYYLDNGASLCALHHMEAEQTKLSVEKIREAAGIRRAILPPHLYNDQPYDKWGNPVLTNGTRLRGDLFFDGSVQKILGEGGMLPLFTTHVKYPRTFHLPWSPGLTKDDRMMTNPDPFKGKEVVATVKMDGENTTMYRDFIHARALSHEPHPSRNWVKALHGRIAYEIPEGWRICGENLYAKHSIHYTNLEDWFQVFSIWNEKNEILPWADTVEWCQLLGLNMVPKLYQGPGDRHLIEKLYPPTYNGDPVEGYVVRLTTSFPYRQFRDCVGKYVRKGHVATHAHWMREVMVANKLKREQKE